MPVNHPRGRPRERKVQEPYPGVDLRREVTAALQALGAAERSGTSDQTDALRRRIRQIDRAAANATRRVLLLDDDEMAKAIMAEAAKLRQERPRLVAKPEALAEAEPPDPKRVAEEVERHLANIRDLEATRSQVPLEDREACLYK